jgi:(p)ppGpp synthase/HD superfamily hydrolase
MPPASRYGVAMRDAAGSPLEARARALAERAHADQRYGTEPYVVHLQAVREVLARFGIEDEVVLAASWLHDILEDHPSITREHLAATFPEPLVAIVDACTDAPGTTREQRKTRPLALIPHVPNAVLVKLADRIANIEACIASNDETRLAMYRAEHATFAAALRHSPATPSADPMWHLLDHLL